MSHLVYEFGSGNTKNVRTEGVEFNEAQSQHMSAAIVLAIYYCVLKEWPKKFSDFHTKSVEERYVNKVPNSISWEWFLSRMHSYELGSDLIIRTQHEFSGKRYVVQSVHSYPDCRKDDDSNTVIATVHAKIKGSYAP